MTGNEGISVADAIALGANRPGFGYGYGGQMTVLCVAKGGKSLAR